MLTALDLIVLVLYLLGVPLFGILAGGRQRGVGDYFLGGRQLPWWAVAFSVVATETSTLTVIGIPAVAYGGSLVFLQLTLGYLLGRIVVSFWLLPRYFAGDMATAYEFLGQRFGDRMRASASVVFMVTRLLADGVRLFATAIPIRVMLLSAGIDASYFAILACIGLATVLYTLIGGIRAVIWMDVVQMFVYLGGALAAAGLLYASVGAGGLADAAAAGKTQMLDLGLGKPLGELLTNAYWFPAAVLGGAVFTMASHGTDHLIVQRLLTCRDLRSSQIALVFSGVAAVFQFGLFLLIGLMLWAHYGGKPFTELGLKRGDEVFPKFIIEGMPPGVSGLLLAGILAAAMSTLSSSLNALASSTVLDLLPRLTRRRLGDREALPISRWLTLGWGIVFVVFANLFTSQENPVVELGLSIASFTYGGLLGAFLLGLLNRRVGQTSALIAFFATIAVMTLVIFGVWHGEQGWVFAFRPDKQTIADLNLKSIGWPWFTALGTGLTLALGFAMSRLLDRQQS